MTCSSSNIIYLITCSRCGVQYVGETSQRLNLRMNNHRTAINGKKDTILYEHFRQEDGCHITHCIVQPIEKIDDSGSKQDQKKKRLEREAFWIKKLRTLTPYGLNDRLDGKNWRYRWRDDIAGKCFIRYLFINMALIRTEVTNLEGINYADNSYLRQHLLTVHGF